LDIFLRKIRSGEIISDLYIALIHSLFSFQRSIISRSFLSKTLISCRPLFQRRLL